MKNRNMKFGIAVLLCSLVSVIMTACASMPENTGGFDSRRDEFVITFYNSVRDTPRNVTIDKNTANLYVSEIPTQSHSTFLGYFDSPTGGSMIFDANGTPVVDLVQDITVYAQWQGDACSLVYLVDGNVIQGKTVYFGDKLTDFPTAPTVDGKNFVGWEHAGTYGKFYLTSDKIFDDRFRVERDENGNISVKVEAVYENRKYVVTFDYNNPDYPSYQLELEHGSAITEDLYKNIVAETVLVSGWSIQPFVMTPFVGEVTEDMVLYAQWVKYKTFTLIDGEDQIRTVNILEGEGLTEGEPIRPGYQFAGYYTSPLFQGNPVKVSYSLTETTLYAKWEPEA